MQAEFVDLKEKDKQKLNCSLYPEKLKIYKSEKSGELTEVY